MIPFPSYPLVQPMTTYTHFRTSNTLSDESLEQIRALVREEVHKALHPEESQPSATVEYQHDGQTWRGTVYLVDEEEGS